MDCAQIVLATFQMPVGNLRYFTQADVARVS
jgi:hypothetical protein